MTLRDGHGETKTQHGTKKENNIPQDVKKLKIRIVMAC
jgi:hypothetical protein